MRSRRRRRRRRRRWRTSIQEILLQQQVNKLLDDWLTALRAQGSVRMVKPGEEAP